MPELTKRERGHLVALLMRDKFLARRIATITARGGLATWDEAEHDALVWAVDKLRGLAPVDVADAERRAEERWLKRSTDKAGEPREPLISAVCRLLGGCEPGAVIDRLEAVLAARSAIRQAHCLDLTEALGLPHEGTVAEVRSWDQLLGHVRSLVAEIAGLRDEAEDAANEQAELAQVGIDDLHREIDRLRVRLRSAEPRAAEAEDRARAAEESQRIAERWAETVRDERDALRAQVAARGAAWGRLVVAAWEVVEAAEEDVPSDEEIAAMAAAHPDGCWTAAESLRDCQGLRVQEFPVVRGLAAVRGEEEADG